MHDAGKKTWVELSRDALHSNIDALSSRLSEDAGFCAVVKANAYGHDAKLIAKECLQKGVGVFAVDSVDEGLQLRKIAPHADILVLGYTVPERYTDVVKRGLIQAVYDARMIELLGEEAAKQQTRAFVNIKVETGLNRQGVRPDGALPLLMTMRQYEKFIDFYGISSHYANAEDVFKPDFAKRQTQMFAEFAAYVFKSGFSPKYVHIACSAAAIADQETQFNLARFGIALYGLWSSDELRRKNRVSSVSIELKPVLGWKTRIAQIKELKPGDTVGYGMTFRADRPMRIAILPVGYYDGYSRAMAGKAHVLVKGQKCRVLGNICMNMLMIDVSHVAQAKHDSIVTLLGRDGMNVVTAEDLAEWCGTINYEVVTRINPLIPRIMV